MASTQFLIVLLLAIGASQMCPVAAAPQPDPQDLQVVIKSAIEILRIIGDAILKAIQDAQASIDKLIAELQVDLGKIVKNVLDLLKGDATTIIDDIKDIEKAVTDALAALNTKSSACLTQFDNNFKPALDTAGKDAADVINALYKANAGNITSIKTEIGALLTGLRETILTSIDVSTKCITSGSTNATAIEGCLDNSTAAFESSIASLAVDFVLLLNELLAWLPGLLSDNVTQLGPVIGALRNATPPVVASYTKCVATSLY